jgi:hypothetical protein
MEGLAHLVNESLIRHGFEPTFDHRRLQWSQWFPCHDSFSLLLAPCKPGLFALGEEVAVFCGASEPRSRHPERSEGSPHEGKRMLALFQISEANDLGMALGRLFLSGNPVRERLASGRCFARYVVVEDENQRRAALTALQRWMASSAQATSGIPNAIPDEARVLAIDEARKIHVAPDEEVRTAHVAPDALVRGAEQNSAGFVGSDSQETAFRSEQGSQKTGFVSGHDFSRAAIPAICTAALAAAEAKSADAQAHPESSNEEAQTGPLLQIPSGF